MRDVNDTNRAAAEEESSRIRWISGVWTVLRPMLVGTAVLVLVVGICMTVWNKLYGEYAAPADETDPAEYAFEITSGQSLNRVAANLEASGLIRNKTVFKYYCDFAGMGQKIQVGNYTLKKSMTLDQIARVLSSGDGKSMVRDITLIPGESIEDFAAGLVNKKIFESADHFLELCQSGRNFSDYYYIEDVLKDKRVSERKYVLEGYLAPDTYEFYTNATEEDIIRRLLSQTETAFPEDYQERTEELGMTMDQVLTLASLIEKEAKEKDFARVSAVFHNRLKAGMKLESDVTIHYITGIRRMALTQQDLRTESPYNTYLNSGLPPGPICSPSRKAVEAALYPDEQMVAMKYLYFCAKEPSSGELYFSRTLEEHERAVAVYAPLWQEDDKNRGIQ